jgi:uncharacterized protein HemX
MPKQELPPKKEKDDVVTGWMIGLIIAIVVPIAAAALFIGQISSRTNVLERTMEQQEKTIKDLSLKTTELEHQVKGHDTTIKKDIGTLKQEMGGIHDEIQSFRKDANDLIHEIRKSWPSEPNN